MTEEENLFDSANNEPEAESTPALKRPKKRSPNYPAIGLEKALERAETIRAQARHHFMPVTTARTLWNYKKGAGDQVVAALKAFGLLEVQGESETRQVRLTEAARRILGNAPDRAELLKVAALKPDLHKEIWEKYEGDLPPADAIIREYLIWERNFNEDFVDSFINQFRSTIAYASIDLSDKIRSDGDDDDGDDFITEDDNGKSMIAGSVKSEPRRKQPPAPSGSREFPLYLTNHQKGTLYIPAEMTHKDYELLQKQIENHMAIILVTSVVSDEEKKEAGDE
jgi:hypothetical protein